jgi:hypothetical protein
MHNGRAGRATVMFPSFKQSMSNTSMMLRPCFLARWMPGNSHAVFQTKICAIYGEEVLSATRWNLKHTMFPSATLKQNFESVTTKCISGFAHLEKQYCSDRFLTDVLISHLFNSTPPFSHSPIRQRFPYFCLLLCFLLS